jgi:hypothetical protein
MVVVIKPPLIKHLLCVSPSSLVSLKTFSSILQVRKLKCKSFKWLGAQLSKYQKPGLEEGSEPMPFPHSCSTNHFSWCWSLIKSIPPLIAMQGNLRDSSRSRRRRNLQSVRWTRRPLLWAGARPGTLKKRRVPPWPQHMKQCFWVQWLERGKARTVLLRVVPGPGLTCDAVSTETEISYSRGACTPMFITALFTIAKL